MTTTTDTKVGMETSIFDDPEALAALAQKSFHTAKRKAIAENDRLGIPSYGSVDGKLVVRQPPQAKTPIGST